MAALYQLLLSILVQRRVTQKARLPVQGGPLVHKYNTHSTIQNKIINKHYTITNKQMLYKTNNTMTITYTIQ